MILKYLSELLRPTDTFRRIHKIKIANNKQAKAIEHAKLAFDAVEIEVMKIDAGARRKFQNEYSKFLKCI